MKRLAILSFAVSAFVVAAPADAKGLKWAAAPPNLPSGAQMAVVKGDPGKAEPFAIQLKMPANYTIAPHSHPMDETVRVRSGGPLTYGMGDKVDSANAGSLAKGYHIVMQAGMHHWASTSQPTVIEVSGTGPFALTYVNPKDDPSAK